jgi:hypothetical protein
MKKTHIWMMIACCLIPIAGLAAVYWLNIPVSRVVYIGLMLFCPLSHVFMMKFMGHDHGSSEQHAQHQHNAGSLPASTEEIRS